MQVCEKPDFVKGQDHNCCCPARGRRWHVERLHCTHKAPTGSHQGYESLQEDWTTPWPEAGPGKENYAMQSPLSQGQGYGLPPSRVVEPGNGPQKIQQEAL